MMCSRHDGLLRQLAVGKQFVGQLGLGLVAPLPRHASNGWKGQPSLLCEFGRPALSARARAAGGGLGDARGDPSLVNLRRGLYDDDDLSLGVSFSLVAEGIGDVAQREAPIDHGGDLFGLDELL